LITGNEDKEIKFYDLRTGSYTDGIQGHQDGVSALDSNGNSLYSGCHEGNLRLWDIRKRECLFDLNTHRKKLDEGVKALSLRGKRLASAGADGLVKIMAAFEQA